MAALPFADSVSVLVYHSISPARGSPRFRCDPKTFVQQLSWLRAARIRVLSLDAFIGVLAGSPSGPWPGGVVLTFDDGYRDFAENAYPILKYRDLPSALFVVAGNLGGCACWPEGISQRSELLSDHEVANLASRGVTIGAHGWSHRRLGSIPRDEALRELSEARRYLETVTGNSVFALAYPYGEDSPDLRALARGAGYRVAFTTKFGTNTPRTDPFSLHRIEIHGDEGLLSFALKVRFGCSLRQLLWLARRGRRGRAEAAQ